LSHDKKNANYRHVILFILGRELQKSHGKKNNKRNKCSEITIRKGNKLAHSRQRHGNESIEERRKKERMKERSRCQKQTEI
jgi:hypothetical protein